MTGIVVDGTVTDVGFAGIELTDDGSVTVAVSRLADRPCAFMFTLRRVFASSSLLPRVNIKKIKNSKRTPMNAAHVKPMVRN